MFTVVRIFFRADQWTTTKHLFRDRGDVRAFLLPPLSDLWASDHLDDLCATVLNMLKTSRRPWRPWRCLNVLCTTIKRPRQLFGPRLAFNGDLTSFVVAKGRHKGRSLCVKGFKSCIENGCCVNQPYQLAYHASPVSITMTPWQDRLSALLALCVEDDQLPAESKLKDSALQNLGVFAVVSLKKAVELTVDMPTIWDAMTLIQLCCNVLVQVYELKCTYM